MNIELPALDASPSALAPLTAVILDRAREGYLVYDRSQRVVHASKAVRSVLRINEDLPLQGAGVMDLLEIAFGLSQLHSFDAGQWLDTPIGQEIQEPKASISLLTASHSRTLQCNLVAIGEEFRIATFQDVTAELDAESEMMVIAYRDKLTGIGNRSLFDRSLDRTLARLATGALQQATLFFLDLDRFKVVNDSLGHAVGDTLLRLVSERIHSLLHSSDMLARLGGDEFAVLLDRSCGKDSAAALAKQMIDIIERPYLIQGQVLHVGASIGIAVAPEDGSARTDLLKNADLALYHSKAAGRGVFHFFHPAMAEKVLRRRALEADLRKALVLRQFELHYRPQINPSNQQIIGLEAKLRWRHPQRGLLLPGEFLALAEEIGLAASIGEWVLLSVCKEAVRWPGSLTVAVKISALQFESKMFAKLVEKALAAEGLPGHQLEIEVTEDILLRDAEIIAKTLANLRALGVRVAIDAFGTGTASLGQLVNFTFDKIKIDPSLVNMQHEATKHRAIVRAVCALGQSLGVPTLAEGIKTAEQLERLQSEGCDQVQGFYCSEAVPADQLMDLFASSSIAAQPAPRVREDAA